MSAAVNKNNRKTINCLTTPPPTLHPEPRLKLFSSATHSSLEATSSNAQCERPLHHSFFSAHCCPFSSHSSKPLHLTFSSHSVPTMQFQVLLTRLSSFFSTFLRSTFPLSVFMSYLDLGEIYLLLCAEITINATLKQAEICKFMSVTREYHPLCYSFPADFHFSLPQPDRLLERSIGATTLQQ
jgi:hypothetical protein